MSDTKDITQNLITTAFDKWADKKWFQILFIVILVYMLSAPIVGPIVYQRINRTDTQEIVSAQLEANDQEKRVSHEASFQRSKEIYTRAKQIMRESIEDIGCDYLFLIEYHNGSENIVNGIQFCRFDITLEVISERADYIQLEKFKDDLVARYDILLSSELATNKLLYYKKDQFEKVDKYLSHQLATVDAKSYAIINLKNSEGTVCGTLLCVSKDDDMNRVAIYECQSDLEDIFNYK